MRTRSHAALWIAAVIWGINAHSVKIACNRLSEAGFLSLRFALALLFGIAWGWFSHGKKASLSTIVRDRRRLKSAVLVALPLSLFYLLQTHAISSYSAVNAVFLTGTAVLWVPIIRMMFSREGWTPSPDTVVGILLSLGGFVVLQRLQFHVPNVGDLLAICAAVLLAIELVIIGREAPKLEPHELVSWTNLYSGITFVLLLFAWAVLPSSVSTDSPRLPTWASSPFAVLGAALFTGIVATGIAQLMANWANGQKDGEGKPMIGADQRALVENLDGPIALLSGLLFFTWNMEPLEWQHMGLLLVAAGIVVSELRLVTRITGDRYAYLH
jgi:drug/metabolite transporter (DMT)-like permease